MGNISFNPNKIKNEKFEIKNIKHSYSYSLSSFVIDNTGLGDYTWSEAVLQPWCSGNGTVDNPYIIKGISIDGMNSSSCLEIRISSVYFEIKNSLFYNSSSVSTDAGIKLFQVQNAKLENNTCIYNNANGIYMFDSDSNTLILNNLSYNAEAGLYFFSDSNNNLVQDNLVTYNQIFSIFLQNSNSNKIYHNKIKYNNAIGLYLYFAENNTLSNNLVYENNGRGINNYQGSHNTKIYKNNVSENLDNGIFLYLSDNLNVSSNFVHKNNNGFWIGQVINLTLINNNITFNSGSGIYAMTSLSSAEITHNFFTNNFDRGITMYTGNEVKIIKNTISDNGDFSTDDGIYLYNFQNGNVSGNKVLRNSGSGISILYSSDNIVNDNQVSENQANGIIIYSNMPTGMSANNSLKENLINKNMMYGIYLVNIQFLPSDTNITQNNVINNSVGGIYIEKSSGNIIDENSIINNSYGIRAYSMSSCLIKSNIFENHSSEAIFLSNSTKNSISFNKITNSGFGIHIYRNSTINEIDSNELIKNSFGIYINDNSDNNTLHGNTIKNSTTIGIKIDDTDLDCDDNLLFENWFISNAIHASEETGTNYWNNTEIGNYWDNYTGFDDSPVDGIGDTPHNLTGGTDYLPIWDDDAPNIKINVPINESRFGYISPNFNIEIQDLNLYKTWYEFIGDSQRKFFTSNGSFEPSLWQSEWNTINDGDYIYIRFYANDTFGNLNVKDIRVKKDDFPIINILSPTTSSLVGSKAPDFLIDVDEYSIDSMWYTLNGGVNNITFTTNGTINQNAWDSVWTPLSDGDIITITFYVRDHLGQISSETIDVIADIPEPSTSGIPGYEVILILNSILIGIIITLFLKKRKKY